jgi:hypothetical protein
MENEEHYQHESTKPEKEPLLSWTFPEFTRHDRGRGWYIGFFLTILTLLTIGFFTTNYTFMAVILMGSFVLLLRLRRQPPDVQIDITEKGITVGGRSYEWSELKDFWIMYKPPEVKQLYFSFKRTIRPDMNIGLVHQNPLKVREVLREYLLENIEREEEPASEVLTRYFKL